MQIGKLKSIGQDKTIDFKHDLALLLREHNQDKNP